MIQTGKQLAAACKKVAQQYKTLYVLGCFGAPMTEKNRSRCLQAQAYNRQPGRKAKIEKATAQTFGFDCVCLVKGLLWGWQGVENSTYGGAVYKSGGVPDVNADTMITRCKQVSRDFSRLQVGALLWNKGHVGVYIGDGLAVECTPKWADGVQITAVYNVSDRRDIPGRTWTKHGLLPWLDYEEPQLCPAASRTAQLAGSYRVTAKSGLRLRMGPGTDHAILTVLPLGTVVRCYGYHTAHWLAVTANGQTGYCSSRYLERSGP